MSSKGADRVGACESSPPSQKIFKKVLTNDQLDVIIIIENEREVIIMRIEKSDDRAYPYTIKGGWGDKVYCTVADLKEIKKQINAILKEEKK